MTMLSIVVVNNPYLPKAHLDLLITALNEQRDTNFNSFWIEQGKTQEPLHALLQKQANFRWHILHAGKNYVSISETLCWELITPFRQLISHPQIGRWWTYLHQECLPVAEFTTVLRQELEQIEQEVGPDIIAALHQLRSPLTLSDILSSPPEERPTLLRTTGGKVWKSKIDYQHIKTQSLSHWSAPWEEDAFVMSTALTRQLKLFEIQPTLYFQDLFNIFVPLQIKKWAQHIHWYRLRDAVIYHLEHPRAFKEYSRPFLNAVQSFPEVFGHLAIFDLAHSHFDYNETFKHGQRQEAPLLTLFYNALLKSRRGTLSLWERELDSLHYVSHSKLQNCIFTAYKSSIDQELIKILSEETQKELNEWWAIGLELLNTKGQLKPNLHNSVCINFESEGRRLWLELQFELKGQREVSYTSPLWQQTFHSLSDYHKYTGFQ